MSLITTVAIISAIVIAFNYFNASRKAHAQLDRKADEYLSFLVDSLSVPLWSFEVETVQHIADAYSQNDLIAGLKITDSRNDIYFNTQKQNPDVQVDQERDIYYKKQLVGKVQLSLSLQSYNRINQELLRQSIFTLIVSIVVIIIMTGFLLRLFLKNPLDHLSDITQSYASGRTDRLKSHETATEFLPFIAVLDEMNSEINMKISELHSAEKKFRSIFENAGDGIFQADVDGDIANANHAMAEILGYSSPAELMSEVNQSEKLMYRILPRYDWLVEQLRGGHPVSGLEMQVKRKDRQEICCLVNGRAVKDKRGHIAMVECFLRDISLRKKAEGELQREKAYLEQLFENPAEAIAIITTDEKIVRVNQAFTKMFQYEQQEVVGRFIDSLITPREHRILREPNSTIKNEVETIRRRKDASLVDVSIVFTPVVVNNTSTGGFVIYRDITERKQAEKDLRSLRNYLSNMVDSMPSILVGVDTEGRVNQWNLEAEKFTGVSKVSAHGRSLHKVLPEFAKEMKKVRLAIKKQETQKESKIPHTINGENRFSEVTVYPLIISGIEGAVIRIDDITERTRIEEMMIQSEKMLSVGGLAAGMAHEINNPLAGILQNLQVMKLRLSKEHDKNRQVASECGTSMDDIAAYMDKRNIYEMMDSIIESGKRAAKIVSNMLSISRKSDSQAVVNNLQHLLDETVEVASSDYDLKKKYDFRRIKITRDYDPRVPEIPCDGSKIQQVFLNILRNGAQAMAGRKEAGYSPHIILRLKNEKERVRIEIEDNGPGMEEALCKRVFEPFFTTKEVGVGTGLGLSVSYFIITENHGGTMTLQSSPGKGAKFIIQLPIKNQT